MLAALVGLILSLMAPAASHAAVVTYNFNGINQVIPDGSILGWSDVRTLSGLSGTIQSVEVMLNIAGGFNGDLYAQLVHSSGFAVLLNRVGRSTLNPSGYLDSGLNIILADNAAESYDIHRYRMAFSGETTPVAGPITGTWKPDGRAVDPATVLDSHLRTALLGSFNGLDPNGEWALFIADMDSGGQATIQNWGLALELLLVPEPRSTTLLMISLIALLGTRRTRRLT